MNETKDTPSNAGTIVDTGESLLLKLLKSIAGAPTGVLSLGPQSSSCPCLSRGFDIFHPKTSKQYLVLRYWPETLGSFHCFVLQPSCHCVFDCVFWSLWIYFNSPSNRGRNHYVTSAFTFTSHNCRHFKSTSFFCNFRLMLTHTHIHTLEQEKHI